MEDHLVLQVLQVTASSAIRRRSAIVACCLLVAAILVLWDVLYDGLACRSVGTVIGLDSSSVLLNWRIGDVFNERGLVTAEMALSTALVLYAGVKMWLVWSLRMPRGLQRRLSSLSRVQTRLLGLLPVNTSSNDTPTWSKHLLSWGSDELTTLITPEDFKSSAGTLKADKSDSLVHNLRYRSAYPTRQLPRRRSTGSGTTRAPVAGVNEGQTEQAMAQAAVRRKRQASFSAVDHLLNRQGKGLPGGMAMGDENMEPAPFFLSSDNGEGGLARGAASLTPVAPYSIYTGARTASMGGNWKGPWDREELKAKTLQERIGLDGTIDEIADSTKKFLGTLIRKYVKRLFWVMDELERRGVMRGVLQYEMPRQPQFRIPGNPSKMRNVSLKDIIYRCLEHSGTAFEVVEPSTGRATNLLVAYQELERVLKVSGNPAYVLQRLKTLADDGYLGAFSWEAGGRYNRRAWATDLPTDAEIAMHVFCCWGDALLSRQHPDDQKHFFEGPESALEMQTGRLMIVRTNPKANPPHFRVIVNGEIWHVTHGRVNTFHAIALFLFAVKEFRSGYLGDVKLGILDEVFAPHQPLDE